MSSDPAEKCERTLLLCNAFVDHGCGSAALLGSLAHRKYSFGLYNSHLLILPFWFLTSHKIRGTSLPAELSQ